MRIAMKSIALIGLIATWQAAPVAARIISVKPIDGLPGKIINAPPAALDSAVASSTHMVGFDERQNVLLSQGLKVDGGIVARGTRVNSHMILFDLPDYSSNNTDSAEEPSEWFVGALADNEWVFSGPVLGVMSDMDGLFETATTEQLGARETTYPSSNLFLRGFEDNDFYDGVGTARLRVRMSVWQPGDWIRVITGMQPIANEQAPNQRDQIAENPDNWP